MGGELVQGIVFDEEARSCGLLQVVVRCSHQLASPHSDGEP
jgi:hypothetical protein